MTPPRLVRGRPGFRLVTVRLTVFLLTVFRTGARLDADLALLALDVDRALETERLVTDLALEVDRLGADLALETDLRLGTGFETLRDLLRREAVRRFAGAARLLAAPPVNP